MDVDDRINEFKKIFDKSIKYTATEFYKWHNRLTGSCKMGRDLFVANKEIDIDHDTFTVSEFIEITKNSYGGEIILKLKEHYRDNIAHK